MEHERPRFLTNAEQEDLQFYKDWIRTALLEGLADVDPLLEYRQRVTLDSHDLQLLRYRGVTVEPFIAAQRELDRHIAEEMAGAVRDLQQNIFNRGLFRVGIEIDGELVAIDGIVSDGTVIVPIIAGEPYSGPFDGVYFDR